ncbi:hypothetical protein [Specibacter sp. RAF43]|uniref:hypothetical protein n=1 Tax=Specibacter sp. RAF43 TaxID=3233057 RepID=UPI003F9CAB0D
MASYMLGQVVDPAAGSAMAADDAAYGWEKCSAWVHSYLCAATENMLMWANAVVPPRISEGVVVHNSPRPYFTLARAGLEAAAQAVWVLKEDSSSERVYRHLRLVYHDLRQNALALEAAQDDRSAHARKRMADLLDRTSGVYDPATIRKDEPKYSSMVAESAPFASLDPDQLLVLWRGASAAAHGKNWFHQVAYETKAGEEYEPGYFRTTLVPDPKQVTKAVDAASSMISTGVLRYVILSGCDPVVAINKAQTTLTYEMRDVLP